MKKTLFITGNGWLGSRLAQKVMHEYSPRIAALPYCDLTNKVDCDNFCRHSHGATIVHTAGIIHPRRVKDFYSINLDATVNLLESAIRNGVKRFIAISSNSVCGVNPHRDHKFDECYPYHPYQHYGISKMLMEQAILEKQSQIEVCILRGCWFYGPNQPERQTTFFKMIAEGKAPIVGDGQSRRSMTYVDNFVQAIMSAVTAHRIITPVYWIADKRPYTMNEIVDTVEHLLEKRFNIKCAHRRMHLPNVASTAAYAADTALQKLGFYNQKIHVLSEMNKTIACTIGLAQRELGYNPLVDLETGMYRSLLWCRENNLI